MRMRRLLAVILALSIGTSSLAACSQTRPEQPSDSSSIPDGQPGASTVVHPEKKIKIYTARSESDAAFQVWDDIIEQYQREVNPNFSAEFESVPNHDQYLNKLRLYIAGDDLPEIYQIDEGPISQELSGAGKMVDVGEELKKLACTISIIQAV